MTAIRGMGLLANRFYQMKEQLFSSRNLFYTNVGISISLSAAGDVLEQHYEILKVSRVKFVCKVEEIVPFVSFLNYLLTETSFCKF